MFSQILHQLFLHWLQNTVPNSLAFHTRFLITCLYPRKNALLYCIIQQQWCIYSFVNTLLFLTWCICTCYLFWLDCLLLLNFTTVYPKAILLQSFFWPRCAASKILVPQLGIEPLQWKHGVLTTGLPRNSLYWSLIEILYFTHTHKHTHNLNIHIYIFVYISIVINSGIS